MGTTIKDVNLPGGIFLASNTPYRKNDYETKEPIKTEDGNYLWQVEVLIPGDRGADEHTVIIEAAKNPVEGFKPMTPLLFKGLDLSFGKMANGKKYYSLKAESVKAA